MNGCRLGEVSANLACTVSASSLLPSPYLDSVVCVQPRICSDEIDPGLGTDAWWQGTLNSCFESFQFFLWSSRERGILGGRRGGGERLGLRVNKQNHSNDLSSSSSLPRPH